MLHTFLHIYLAYNKIVNKIDSNQSALIDSECNVVVWELNIGLNELNVGWLGVEYVL